ncbi:hypothetical protein CROQUDRAFT_132025 [Cronartium quercuum f. sp. fusiforme G11]|uniref:Cyclin N-terminal domain-containing protein n=1 Tax=Cronartium quercuum f. sp. fusiforme G11 TaxID=708437 RepID=A0A9P6NQ02_9BASI|nr:hypothetical protein CROQUDRAFT_132025 [Cronartium quercuum f. sp. fusiforme G11]
MAPSIQSRLTTTHSPAIAKRRSGQSVGKLSTTTTVDLHSNRSSNAPRPYRSEEQHDRDLLTMLLVGEYREEVEQYMHQLDAETVPAVETMDLQPELEWFMRPYLIDFLIEIHQQYRLRPETLYLAVNIVDRYVARRVVFKKHYQLVGCAALWMAAKYEDAKERVPGVGELGAMCCGAYEEASFVQMEGHVLSTIGWQLGHPTPEAFLRIRLADDSQTAPTSAPLAHLARFLMELSLFDRAFVGSRSAEIACGALMLARFILGQPRRPSEESEGARRVMCLLDETLGDRLGTISPVVVKKYGYGNYSRASRVVGDWYAAGHRLSRPAPRSLSSLSITSSPTSSVLTMSSSGPRSVTWSSPGSSVKAEEEDDVLEAQQCPPSVDGPKGGLQASPSMPERMRHHRLDSLPPSAAVTAAASKLDLVRPI